MLNNQKSKVILILIGITLIVIIVCVCLLYFLRDKDQEMANNTLEANEVIDEEKDYESEWSDREPEKDGILAYTDNRRYYFTVEGIINTYINNIAFNMPSQLMNMLADDYVSQYNINKDNVISQLGRIEVSEKTEYVKYLTTEMLQTQEGEYTIAFLVRGKYRLSDASEYKQISTIVEIDYINNLYKIYPEQYIKTKEYNNLKVGKRLILENKEIQEKDNKFTYAEKDDKEYANEVFSRWFEMILYDRQEAYNKLNSEYKNIRFNTYNNFNNYLNNLKYLPSINEYKIYNEQENYTDYICTDQYNNYYVFRQQGGTMRYTVFLDSYTVALDSFKQTYNEQKDDEEAQVRIQIGKFKQMLNTKDYNAIYKKLNATFRNNNYKNVNQLAQYLQKKTYDINTIAVEDIEKNGDYYVCSCTLTNQKNEQEEKNMTIMIKLIDDNNFEMSFNIQ